MEIIKYASAKFKKWISLQSFVIELRRKYRELPVKRPLTCAQRREIQQYYKELIGHRVPLIWHKYSYSRIGIYSKKYIPVGVYRIEMIGRMNNFPMMSAYGDKNISEQLFPDVLQPTTYVSNSHGHYYAGGKAITREEAIAQCWNLESAVIKPSLSTRGAGVRLIEVKEGRTNLNGKTIGQLFDDYGEDFLVQSKIVQHAAMEALNPTSVNTIRLLTYRSNDEVLVVYTVIRIGRKGSIIDNESAGGISARINSDGRLAKYAFGAPGVDQVEKTDTGITLEGYEIPSYQAVVDTAKRLHLAIPQFNLAAWDFAVSENGEPLFIEWNTNPDLSQSAFGPAFGDLTERILKEIYTKKNTRHNYW